MLDEALHVLAANQGNVLAEAPAILLGEPPPVSDLLGLHGREHARGGGEVGFESLYNVAVDARILFFERHRESQDLTLVELAERSGHGFALLKGP